MSRKISAREKKETGAHFTPPELARFIANKLITNCEVSSRLRVLDPSCGDGELLLAFHDALPAERRPLVTLLGIDQDPHSIVDARERLAHLTCDVQLKVGDFLAEALSLAGQRSLWNRGATTYANVDVVIANPPYVRTQVLGASKAQELANLFNLSGRVDLYQAFLAAMATALRPGGLIGVITSNRYLTTRGGLATRRFLNEEFDILELVDLGDTKLFEAAVLPALFFGRRKSESRSGAQRTKFVRIYEAASLSSSEEATRSAGSVIEAVGLGHTATYAIAGINYVVSGGEIEIASDPQQPWSMATSREGKWIDAINASALARFGDIAKIRVGVKSTADAVFIRSDWASLPEAIRPEPAVLRSLISQDTVSRWAPAVEPTRKILYTHEVIDGRRVPINFEKTYPRAWAYLLANRERLEGRKYVAAAGRAWYEIWVPQDPDAWDNPKLVFPDISPAPKFLFDSGGYLVDGNCYWATLREGESADMLFLMLAVSNSGFMTRYHEIAFQNMLYSGRRRYLTQYVERYPVPDPSTSAAEQLIQRARQRVKAVGVGALTFESESDDDRLVAEAFGVTARPT